MIKGDLICTIGNVNFFYGGWIDRGYHSVYTQLYSFRVRSDILRKPTKSDCETIYNDFKNKYGFAMER